MCQLSHLTYVDMTQDDVYYVQVKDETVFGYLLWWDTTPISNRVPHRIGPCWTLLTINNNAYYFSPNELKEWMMYYDTLLSANHWPIPSYSQCAECDSPVYYNVDYLCQNCRSPQLAMTDAATT